MSRSVKIIRGVGTDQFMLPYPRRVAEAYGGDIARAMADTDTQRATRLLDSEGIEYVGNDI